MTSHYLFIHFAAKISTALEFHSFLLWPEKNDLNNRSPRLTASSDKVRIIRDDT